MTEYSSESPYTGELGKEDVAGETLGQLLDAIRDAISKNLRSPDEIVFALTAVMAEILVVIARAERPEKLLPKYVECAKEYLDMNVGIAEERAELLGIMDQLN